MSPTELHDRPTHSNNGSSHHIGDLPQLIGKLTGQLSRLARQEFHLAKAETIHNAKVAAADSATMAGGGVLILSGLLFTLATIAALLSQVMPLWGALACVAAGSILVGAVLVKVGRDKLSDDTGYEHTPATLKRNKQFLAEQIS